MVETEYIGILLPVLLSIGASVALFAFTRASKTSEGTLTGTIKLEHVQSGLAGLEERMTQRFDKMEVLITSKDKENRESFQKVYERLEQIESESKLHSFRLDLLDKHHLKRDSTKNE